MAFLWISRIFLLVGAIFVSQKDFIHGGFYFVAALFYILESINEKIK